MGDRGLLNSGVPDLGEASPRALRTDVLTPREARRLTALGKGDAQPALG